MDRAAAF